MLLPLVALFLLYAALLLVGGWLLFPEGPPYTSSATFSAQGLHFFLPSARTAWKDSLFASLVFSLPAQEAMFAVWAVFTPGKWYFRFVAALAAMVMLVALLQVRLAAPIEDWHDSIDPVLLMPLILLSLAAPLSTWAIWSGRRLRRVSVAGDVTKDGRHFSIANILTLTAMVAIALSLARLCQYAKNETRIAWFMLTYSTIHVLPLVWFALAVRRSWFSVGTTLATAAIFSIPFVVFAIKVGEWAVTAGTAGGLVWTVPLSLLCWRFCGYRLTDGAPREKLSLILTRVR